MNMSAYIQKLTLLWQLLLMLQAQAGQSLNL